MDIFRNARQTFLRRPGEQDQSDLERQQARLGALRLSDNDNDQTLPAGSPMHPPEMQQQMQQPQQHAAMGSPPATGRFHLFGEIPRPAMPSLFGHRQSGHQGEAAVPRPPSSEYTSHYSSHYSNGPYATRVEDAYDFDEEASVGLSSTTLPNSSAQQRSNVRRSPLSSTVHGSSEEEIVSPKTPQFAIGMPPLPSTRLDFPDLQQTWTSGLNQQTTAAAVPPPPPGAMMGGQNQPQGRGLDHDQDPLLAQPIPVFPAQHIHGDGVNGLMDDGMDDDDDDYDDGSRHRHDRRRRFHGSDPAETHLHAMAEDGRQRRQRRRQQQQQQQTGGSNSRRHNRRRHEAGGNARARRRNQNHHHHHHHHHNHHRRNGSSSSRSNGVTTTGSGSTHHSRRHQRRTPKRFMYCFPWVRSRAMRHHIIRGAVAGLIMIVLLAVYLGLTLTKSIANNEFSVMLILVLLFVSVFFFHSLIRITMLVMRPRAQRLADEEDGRGSSSHSRRRNGPLGMAEVTTPGGYAVPNRPIRVVMARDEEAAGIGSIATKTQPPAYGLWRESVRVDPNRIYWQRNDMAPINEMPGLRGGAASQSGTSTEEDLVNNGRRPPSYASDDGVRYVVEAQPRSIAPAVDAPLPQHPAEAGRTAHAGGW